MDTTSPEGVHKIPHIQSLLDILSSEQLPPWTQGISLFGNYLIRQWNVTGNNQVARVHAFYYFIIRNIKPWFYLNTVNEF